MSNHPDTCDSLHAINLALDVVSIAVILLLRYISYLMLCIYLAARHYGHVTYIRICDQASENGPSGHIKFDHLFQLCCIITKNINKKLT